MGTMGIMEILYEIGAGLIFAVLGCLYLFFTPKYKSGSGMRTVQSLRGKDEWNFGHKIIGLLFIFYGAVTGTGAFVISAAGIKLNNLMIICIYGTLMLTGPFVMNAAIKKKFGVDEEIERQRQERIDAHNAWVDEQEKRSAERKAERQKEAARQKRVKESNKKAKEAKKAKKSK